MLCLDLLRSGQNDVSTSACAYSMELSRISFASSSRDAKEVVIRTSFECQIIWKINMMCLYFHYKFTLKNYFRESHHELTCIIDPYLAKQNTQSWYPPLFLRKILAAKPQENVFFFLFLGGKSQKICIQKRWVNNFTFFLVESYFSTGCAVFTAYFN